MRRGEERREQRGEDRRRDERKREVAKVQGEWLDVARPDVAKAHTRTDRNMHTHLNTHVFLETIHPQTHTDFLPPTDQYTSIYFSRFLLTRVCITVADCGAVFTALRLPSAAASPLPAPPPGACSP